MKFENHRDVVAFLTGADETETLGEYEELYAVYQDRLKPTLSITGSEDAVKYQLTVENPAEQNGLRSGKGSPIVSRLLKLRLDVNWPQHYTGELSMDEVPTAYQPDEPMDNNGLGDGYSMMSFKEG